MPRPQREMEMVRHQAISEHAHGQTLAGVGKECLERLVVAVLVKDLSAAVAPIDDVVAIAAARSSSGAWQAGIVAERSQGQQWKVECPLFYWKIS